MATIFGTAGDDTIIPGFQSIGIIGVEDPDLGGDDFITGDDGTDLIDGGAGNDHLFVSAGTVRGGVGDDLIFAGLGTDGPIDADGGDGIDTLFATGFTGDVTSVSVTSIEVLRVQYSAIVTPELIAAISRIEFPAINASNRQLSAASAGEYDFSDIPVVGLDLVFSGSLGDDTIRGTASSDFLSGGGGDDRVVGNAGGDNLGGSAGSDTIAGGQGNDTIDGGDSIVFAGVGQNDRLRGGDGNDVVRGGDGDDTLRGGAGDDTLSGGSNNSGPQDIDTFVFARANLGGHDVITDFQNDLDQLLLIGFGFTTPADVIAAATTATVGDITGTLITLPSFAAGSPASVFLENFALENLDATDIVLG